MYAHEYKCIHFVRTDRNDVPIVAERHCVLQTNLCTKIGSSPSNCVSTVEHLMAALTLNGIEKVRIELSGEEVPILDGSAIIWSRMIEDAIDREDKKDKKANRKRQSQSMKLVQRVDSFVLLWAHQDTKIHASIEFGAWYESYHYTGQKEQILGARSFVLEEWIEALKQNDRILGAQLTNGLVKTNKGWRNGPLRWENEAARHKVLDLIGDLSLAHLSQKHMMISYKSGHSLHIAMTQII